MKAHFSGVIVLVFIGFITSAAQAQNSPIDKKSINVGGLFSISSMSGDLYGDVTQTQISFTPSFRYFIIRGLAVGGDLVFERNSSGDSSSTVVGIGPAITFAFDVKSDKFYPVVGAGFGYANEISSWGGYWSGSSSSNGFQIRFGGGVLYMLKRNLAITAGLDYYIQSLTPENGDSQSGGVLAFSVGLAGFIY
jgi:hypothetical protein